MKITEKKYYVCEKCGYKSQNEQKAKDCAVSHVGISLDSQIIQVYDKGMKIPPNIIVTLEDGSTAIYGIIKHMEAQS